MGCQPLHLQVNRIFAIISEGTLIIHISFNGLMKLVLGFINLWISAEPVTTREKVYIVKTKFFNLAKISVK